VSPFRIRVPQLLKILKIVQKESAPAVPPEPFVNNASTVR
jgi:hypothetical protein